LGRPFPHQKEECQVSLAVEFLTVKEVQDRLRVSRFAVDKMIQNGTLDSLRVGRSIRVPAASLEAFIATQINKTQATRAS
jgi:excisionase family DNA binding protein